MQWTILPQENPHEGTKFSTSKKWLFHLCYPLTGSLRARKMQIPARSLPKARAFKASVYPVKASRNESEIILQLSRCLVNEPDDERIPHEPKFYLLSSKRKPCYFLLWIQEALASNFLLRLGIIYYNFLKYIKNLKAHHLFHQSISRMIYNLQHFF